MMLTGGVHRCYRKVRPVGRGRSAADFGECVNVLLNANGRLELAPLPGSACASAAANGIPGIAVDAGAKQTTVILVPTATCPEPVRFVVAVHQGAVTPVASVVPAGTALPEPPGAPPGTAAPSRAPT